MKVSITTQSGGRDDVQTMVVDIAAHPLYRGCLTLEDVRTRCQEMLESCGVYGDPQVRILDIKEIEDEDITPQRPQRSCRESRTQGGHQESMEKEFRQQAIKVLENNLGKKYCYRCWGQAAGMTSPEALQQLSSLAATFVQSPDHTAILGTCHVCRKDTWIVLKLP